MIKRMDEEAKASFEEMYLTYQDTLRRLAYAYDIPVDDIDDIIQDTFVSYARYDYSLKQPEEGKKILLGRILRSRCMDFHRQKKKRYCEDLNGETFAASIPGWGRPPGAEPDSSSPTDPPSGFPPPDSPAKFFGRREETAPLRM